MIELVERYIHQVGRYLPPKERAEIEAELRSQIQDQLDDRYAGSPSQADVAAVLAELGEPHKVAASYNRDQYLVGPDLYPYMMMVLRHVWVIIPTVVIFINIFGALISSPPRPLIDVIVETVGGIFQATATFSAVVVLIFAVIQRISAELEKELPPFNPLNLPKVDDPRTVDRFELAFGIIFAAFMLLIFFYFLHVGGLTLRFNLNDPGEVIPFPALWMILLISNVLAIVFMSLWVLWRNRWTFILWLIETIFEVFGTICLYFVLYEPVYQRIVASTPALANSSIPEIIVIVTAVLTLIGRAGRLIGLWNYRNNATPPFAVKAN